MGSTISWQIFGLAALIAGGVICLCAGPELPGAPPVRRASGRRHSPLNWGVVIAYGIFGMGYIIPATYLPVMARAIVTDPLIFGWAWPVFGAAACLSTILAARLQPRFSNRQVWVASQLVLAFGLLLPAIHPSIVAIQIAGFCVGGTFMIITMVGLKEAHRLAPPEDVVRHVGAMTAAFATGQMAGPVFASALHDLTGGFALSLIVTSAALVLTLAPLVRRERRKEAASL
jgi:predicted MFS family arabinose efflux permease